VQLIYQTSPRFFVNSPKFPETLSKSRFGHDKPRWDLPKDKVFQWLSGFLGYRPAPVSSLIIFKKIQNKPRLEC
jgi:hypothetical protein